MKAYPSYKESAIGWLGKVPEGWAVKRVKWLCNVKRGQSPRPIDDSSYFDENGEFAWVRISDVTASDKYLYQTEQKLSELGASKSVKLEPDELFVSIAATVGKPIINKIKCCIHDGFVWLEGLEQSKDFFYFVFSGGELYKGLGKIGTQLNLNSEYIANIYVPVPPKDEQKIIVKYLEHKTVQIDTLIEKKQRQIDLLQEQRTALINHAVTKGLNPDVRMKDSGVEWLGEIPSHWIVSKLKYVCYVSDGNHGEEYPEENDFTDEANGVPFIRVTEFEGFNITHNGILYITKEKNESMRKGGLQENDILFVNRGSIGKMALVSKEFEGANLNSQIAYFRVTSPKMNYKYLLYFLYSGTFQKMISSLIHGGALQQLPLKRIIGLEVLCPPLEDQIEIVNYLEKITTKADLSIKSISKEIELVQEYRTALISEAVTGKIDVRTAV